MDQIYVLHVNIFFSILLFIKENENCGDMIIFLCMFDFMKQCDSGLYGPSQRVIIVDTYGPGQRVIIVDLWP